MSLQVWLPLTKDLRNQGLDNVTITNNGATFDSAGKLGGCYSFNNSAIGIGATNITLDNTFSIACWIKVNSYNSDWANAFKIYKDGYDYIGLCMNQTSASTKQLGFHIYKNNGSNARTGVYDAYYMPLTIGTWYHLCFVVTPSEVKTYQNGINIRTGSITTTFPSVSNYNLSLGKSSLFSSLDCSMNDFRLYDHALSQMEVKELAKGLVLHYPLNRQGWGQENLYTGSKDFSGSWTNGGSWTTSSEVYQGFTVKQKSSVWGGIVQNIPCTTGDIFTISFFAKVQSGGSILSIHRSSLGNVTTGLTILGGNFSSGTTWITETEDGTQWKRYWATVRIDSSDITYLQWRIENSIAEKTLYICGMKMEKGSIVTPWCPNSSDTLATTMGLNSTTEYDCSGFCNNGTRTGTFSWTSDTPKYQVSTIFPNGTDYIAPEVNLGSVSELTVSFWVKPSSSDGGYATILAYHNNPVSANSIWIAINCESKSIWVYRGAYIDTSGTLPDDIWSHCVFTYDNGTPAFYINGVSKAVSRQSYTATTLPLSGFNIGNSYTGTSWNTKFYGGLSDFRIYTTALSAAQIKELYETSMSIDNKGNIYTRELVEI